MICDFEEKYTDGIISLWNETAATEGYREMDRRRFAEIFTWSPYFRPDMAPGRVEAGRVCGFACGCVGDDLPLGNATGYLTCVLLAPSVRSDAGFDELLGRLEQGFLSRGRRQSDVLFFNPMMLPWYIPGTDHREHNNAPGAMAGSYFHRSLLRCGYAERARESAMYRDLAGFSVLPEIVERERAAARLGYEVALFDPARHHGVAGMLRALENPLWQEEITRCTGAGTPVLVAARDGETVGFAGPVVRQANGRGYFTGIGVTPAHEGHGLGTILFFRLCEALRKAGADYMSLFTGTGNPAARIYRQAGFRPVQEFAVMRRKLA